MAWSTGLDAGFGRRVGSSRRRSDLAGGSPLGLVLLVLAADLEVDVDDDPVDEEADPPEGGDQAEIDAGGFAEGEQGGLRWLGLPDAREAGRGERQIIAWRSLAGRRSRRGAGAVERARLEIA